MVLRGPPASTPTATPEPTAKPPPKPARSPRTSTSVVVTAVVVRRAVASVFRCAVYRGTRGGRPAFTLPRFDTHGLHARYTQIYGLHLI